MALYIPHSIFHLARLLYVRPETFGPYYISTISFYILPFILHPWRWPHDGPKHGGVHCVCKLISIYLCAFVNTTIIYMYTLIIELYFTTKVYSANIVHSLSDIGPGFTAVIRAHGRIFGMLSSKAIFWAVLSSTAQYFLRNWKIPEWSMP